VWAALALALALGAAPASGQEPQATPAVPAPDTLTSVPNDISARGAFLRAALIPGWGHAAIGSYNRAAFYFTVEGVTAWQLVKTRRHYSEAQQRTLFYEEFIRSGLADLGVTDPEEIQVVLDADEKYQDLLGLEDSRRQQREDWTAVGIFLLFLSGADAYVSAHLRHFPLPLDVNAVPVGNGRMELSVGLTLPR